MLRVSSDTPIGHFDHVGLQHDEYPSMFEAAGRLHAIPRRPLALLVSRIVGGSATLHCIIVKRGKVEEYDALYKMFGSRVPVVWDRRRVSRPMPATGGARPADRRQGSPPSWVALGFVVVDRADY
jgi:hypothetical protein